MISKAIAMSVAAVSMVTSAAFAADLTERLMSERMTVVKVDRAQGRFLCRASALDVDLEAGRRPDRGRRYRDAAARRP